MTRRRGEVHANHSNEIFILTAMCGLVWQPVSAEKSGQSETGHPAINFSTSLLLRQCPVLWPSVEVGE